MFSELYISFWGTENGFRREGIKVRCYLRLAEVGNVHNLEVHDARAHKGGYGGGHDLRGEGVALRDLEVVGQLQIVREIQCMCRGHVSAAKGLRSIARSWLIMSTGLMGGIRHEAVRTQNI